jgi:hypothetical protein
LKRKYNWNIASNLDLAKLKLKDANETLISAYVYFTALQLFDTLIGLQDIKWVSQNFIDVLNSIDLLASFKGEAPLPIINSEGIHLFNKSVKIVIPQSQISPTLTADFANHPTSDANSPTMVVNVPAFNGNHSPDMPHSSPAIFPGLAAISPGLAANAPNMAVNFPAMAANSHSVPSPTLQLPPVSTGICTN